MSRVPKPGARLCSDFLSLPRCPTPPPFPRTQHKSAAPRPRARHTCTATLCRNAALPGASPYRHFLRVTNPHECALSGVRVLGTSGQALDDIERYSRGLSR